MSLPNDAAMEKLELKISYMLRYGVLLVALLLAAGWLWMWAESGDMLNSFTAYNPVPLADTLQQAMAQRDAAVLLSFAGLALLVLLPVLRVATTAWLFLRQKDYFLAVAALLVFAALALSCFLGAVI